jgi:hypothetical protein
MELTGYRVIWLPPSTRDWDGMEASIVRRTLATTMTAGLLLLGCTASEDDDLLEIQATEEPTPEPTEDPEPEPEPEDPYAVPDEIDEAYVERVINAILEVQSEVLRGALSQEQGENLDPDLVALHFATTEGRQRTMDLEILQKYIDDPATRGGLLPVDQQGDMRFDVELVIHAEVRCIIVVGRWDRTRTSTRADSEEVVAFSLSRIDDAASVSEGNPTPWQWRGSTLMVDSDGEPIDRQFWQGLDYGDVLDHICEEL